MTDARRTPANSRVFAAHLSGQPAHLKSVAGQPRQVAQVVVDLLRAPNGPRDRQLMQGETVTLYETLEGWSFVQAAKDGYVGYLPNAALEPAQDMTHWVAAAATHAYEAADFKSPDRCSLSFGSLVRVLAHEGSFAKTNLGYVPSTHLRARGDNLADPIRVAELFLNTPYLWGGNSRWGIDCSGLVQAAHLACGIPCPGDSDQQEAELGESLANDSPYRRGDLLFWKGHVALVRDESTLVHANAHAMAVAIEPIEEAIHRIKAQGDGPVTSHKRLSAQP